MPNFCNSIQLAIGERFWWKIRKLGIFTIKLEKQNVDFVCTGVNKGGKKLGEMMFLKQNTDCTSYR